MRVLVATQYYRPEVGATQNRLGTFVDGLAAAGHTVEVICEQPNHPSGIFRPGFGRRPLYSIDEGGVRVRRAWVAASPRKTMLRRLAFYATFALGAGALAATVRHPDVVFASSPPLPGALAVAAAARARRVPFVLDVRDIWPAAAEALGELSNPSVIGAFERAERWIYRTSACVTTTTEPFCAHIDARSTPGKAVHLPNGAMDELLAVRRPEQTDRHEFTVGYAGNFGIAQGLGVVLDAATALADAPVRFLMVGEGPVKRQFLADRDRLGLRGRIEVRSGMPLPAAAQVLAGCDALLVPLRDAPVLRDFIPSKLYDAMALGLPALVAAAGEPHRLVRESGCGVATGPEDGRGLADAIRLLMNDPGKAAAMGEAGRVAAQDLLRSQQVKRLESVLADAAGGPRCAA